MRIQRDDDRRAQRKDAKHSRDSRLEKPKSAYKPSTEYRKPLVKVISSMSQYLRRWFQLVRKIELNALRIDCTLGTHQTKTPGVLHKNINESVIIAARSSAIQSVASTFLIEI